MIYETTNYTERTKFSAKVNWNGKEQVDEVQLKYSFFLNIYETGVKKNIKIYEISEERRDNCLTEGMNNEKKTGNAWKEREREILMENQEGLRASGK